MFLIWIVAHYAVVAALVQFIGSQFTADTFIGVTTATEAA